MDVAVGVSQAQLDALSREVYPLLHASLLQGRVTSDRGGEPLVVTFDLTAPPTFDLAGGAAVRARLATAVQGAHPDPDVQRAYDEVVGLAGGVFVVHAPAVSLSITLAGQTSAPVVIAASFDCGLVVHDGTSASLVAADLQLYSLPGSDDPLLDFSLALVRPMILAALQGYLGSLSIPALPVTGAAPGQALCVVTPDHLVVVANLEGRGAPDAMGVAWPAADFFALLGPAALQSMVEYGASQKGRALDAHASGTAGPGGVARFEWRCGAKVARPRATLDGVGLRVDYDLSGSVQASARLTLPTPPFVPPLPHPHLPHPHLPHWDPHHPFSFKALDVGPSLPGALSTSLGFDLAAAPEPQAALALAIDGGRLRVRYSQVNRFAVRAHLTTSGPAKLVGYVADPIASAAATGIALVVEGFFKGIDFYAHDLPVYRVSAGGVSASFGTQGLSIASAGGRLVVAGRLVRL